MRYGFDRWLGLGCLFLVLTAGCDDEASPGDDVLPDETATTGKVSYEIAWRALSAYARCYEDELSLHGFVLFFLQRGWLEPAKDSMRDSVLPCVAEALSCEEVEHCLGRYEVNGCVASQRCEGSVSIRCGDTGSGGQREIRTDCAVDPDGNRECNPDSLMECDAGPCEVSRCDGTTALTCFEGRAYATRCDLLGRDCVEEDGDAFCKAAPCLETHCEGQVKVVCDDAKAVKGFDCATIGPNYDCIDDPESADLCIATTARCTEPEVRCEGTVAKVCWQGDWIDIDCASFMNGVCEPGDGFVRCVDP